MERHNIFVKKKLLGILLIFALRFILGYQKTASKNNHRRGTQNNSKNWV